MVCVPPWGACQEAAQTFLHPAADWGAQATVWQQSRHPTHHCEFDIRVLLQITTPNLNVIVAFITFSSIFIPLFKVTVDSATLQAMEGVENASVSQDTLGNTTIIYEQGWCCYPEGDGCTTGVVWHVWQFFPHAPQQTLICQPKMPFTCCWTWVMLGNWLETLYRLVLWLLTTLTDTERESKTAWICPSRLQW